MNAAPYELLLISFPKNRFRGEIRAALKQLISDGIIRIIDIIFVTKNKEGEVSVAEMTELEKEDYEAFKSLIPKTSGFLNEKDAEQLAKEMKNDSSAGLMIFEDTWAGDFAQAVDRAGGEVIVSERIPKSALDNLNKK